MADKEFVVNMKINLDQQEIEKQARQITDAVNRQLAQRGIATPGTGAGAASAASAATGGLGFFGTAAAVGLGTGIFGGRGIA